MLSFIFVFRRVKEFKSHCQYYFVEVVSTLCFGGESAPEPTLIKILLDIIFTESDLGIATREIVPLSDEKIDKIPVIRSSLLQLLLEHKCVSFCCCILNCSCYIELSSFQ